MIDAVWRLDPPARPASHIDFPFVTNPRFGPEAWPGQHRVAMTLSCRDSDEIPKVAMAGQVVTEGRETLQIMHNGVKVLEGGYARPWMTRLISELKGHHDPQDEKAFHAVLLRLAGEAEGPRTMLEVGSRWGYYSLWFLKAFPGARALLVEPTDANLEIGRRNFALNGASGEFIRGFIGAESSREPVRFDSTEGEHGPALVPRWSIDDLMRAQGVASLDILHADIQGAELEMLQGAANAMREGRIRFAFISTHHHAISGDPLIHARCLDLLRSYGARILVECSVSESFSGDGLIVAAFSRADDDMPPIEISRNLAARSLFRETEHDLAWLAQRTRALESQLAELKASTSWRVTTPLRSLKRLWLGLHASPRHQGLHPLAVSVPGKTLRMAVHDTDAYISPSIRAIGLWEPVETRLFASLLRPGATVVDVGANIGYYTLLASRGVGRSGRVVAFEPDPANCGLLRRNLEVNGIRNVRVVEAAAGDAPGIGALYHAPENLGDHRMYASGDGRPSLPVDVVRLDDVMTEEGRPLDVLKIDAQGAEMKILEGARDTIARNVAHIVVILEFWPQGLLLAGSSAEALMARLEGYGFQVATIDEHGTDLMPTTWAALRALAAGGLRPSTDNYTNLVVARQLPSSRRH